jgi:hypothetical protein
MSCFFSVIDATLYLVTFLSVVLTLKGRLGMVHVTQETAQILAQRMAEELMRMPIDEALPLTRACSHYLNLTSIAETHHR